MTYNLRRAREALIPRATWLMTWPSPRPSMGLCQQWAVARQDLSLWVRCQSPELCLGPEATGPGGSAPTSWWLAPRGPRTQGEELT